MAYTSSKAHILIIEDDPLLNDQIAKQLSKKGYSIEQCFCGDTGLTAAISKFFDLILLDVLLPVRDGFSVLNNLRKTRNTPVMMLTACGAEEDRITGFSKGADDYLPKPFSFTELGLRIDAILRRTQFVNDSAADANEIVRGLLRLNKHTQFVSYNNTAVTMTPIQFKLLWLLLSNQHEVLSKAFLYPLVLEREFSAYDRSLDMHLSRVRRKLVDAGMEKDKLKTVHGLGYTFV